MEHNDELTTRKGDRDEIHWQKCAIENERIHTCYLISNEYQSHSENEISFFLTP